MLPSAAHLPLFLDLLEHLLSDPLLLPLPLLLVVVEEGTPVAEERLWSDLFRRILEGEV